MLLFIARRSANISWISLLALCLALFVQCVPAQAAVTAEQRKQLNEADTEISAAAKLYVAGKFEESAKHLTAAQKAILKLLETKDAALQNAVLPQYKRLEKAHALLELEGAQLEELPRWDDLTAEQGKPKPNDISFKNEIGPWLVSQCGNCHVNNRRGKFSMASFNDLMQGVEGRKVINPGSKGSRLVEVIEGGEMPPNGKVSSENLTRLRQWIEAGAKFDGPDPGAPLLSYARPGGASANPADDVPAMATGKETVKFSTDIAPILLENCIGCHIKGRRSEGGFDMNNFTAMRRGGRSGPAIDPGSPDDSLLIKKLKGLSGQRMPVGRPALSEEKINLISTWIKENATFDGPNPNLRIEDAISRAWAANASHSDLLKKRTERAQTLWKKVLPTNEPSVEANDEIIVLGNITPDRAKAWLSAAGNAMTEVRKQLRIPGDSIIKGGVTVFIYRGRYDYSEFGRMNEDRQLPQTWQAHWRASPLDVYVAIVDDTTMEAKQQTALLVQHLSGAYVGSLQTPTWFAEGIARNVAVATAPRGDGRIEAWKRSMPAALALVDKSENLLEGKLDDEAIGLVGMKLTSVMMDRRNRKAFDSLMGQLREGKPFTESLTATFGPPDKFVKAWLGK